jgi:hypothetical protein
MPNAVVAIVTTTIASCVIGSLWYLALGKRWRSAVGWAEGPVSYRPRPAELAMAFVGQLAMAIALWIVMGLTNPSGMVDGGVTGAAMWLGFVLPTLATNVVFQRRGLALIWQDGGIGCCCSSFRVPSSAIFAKLPGAVAR